MRIQLFIPCFVDQLFPDTAFNMVKVLEKLGCEIFYNSSQTCCGQPAFNAGYWDEASAVAKKFLSDFNHADYVVSPSGSCTGFVRNHYHKLLPGTAETSVLSKNTTLAPAASPVQQRLYEFTEFLTDVLKVEDVGAVMNATGTYHDACGALRECNIRDAPRKLLARVRGLEIREADACETCCGFGGTFAVKYEPISIGMAEQKVISALETGADYIISTDLSCLMHLEAYIKRHKLPIKTMHIADILASGW